jgi:hypothetical protein
MSIIKHVPLQDRPYIGEEVEAVTFSLNLFFAMFIPLYHVKTHKYLQADLQWFLHKDFNDLLEV